YSSPHDYPARGACLGRFVRSRRPDRLADPRTWSPLTRLGAHRGRSGTSRLRRRHGLAGLQLLPPPGLTVASPTGLVADDCRNLEVVGTGRCGRSWTHHDRIARYQFLHSKYNVLSIIV